jgi:hypothetical protein
MSSISLRYKLVLALAASVTTLVAPLRASPAPLTCAFCVQGATCDDGRIICIDYCGLTTFATYCQGNAEPVCPPGAILLVCNGAEE